MDLNAFIELAKTNPLKALETLRGDKELQESLKNLEGDKYPSFIASLAANALASGADPATIYSLVKALAPAALSDQTLLSDLDAVLYNLGLRDRDRFLQEYKALSSLSLPRSSLLYKTITTGAIKVVEDLENGDVVKAYEDYSSLPQEGREALLDLAKQGLLSASPGELEKLLQLGEHIYKAQHSPPEQAYQHYEAAYEIAKSLGLGAAEKLREAAEAAKAAAIQAELAGATIDEAMKKIAEAPQKYRSILAASFIYHYLESHKGLTDKEQQAIMKLASQYGVPVKTVEVTDKEAAEALKALANAAIRAVETALKTGDVADIEKLLKTHGEELKAIKTETGASLYDVLSVAKELVESQVPQAVKVVTEASSKCSGGDCRLGTYELSKTIAAVEKLVQAYPVIKRAQELGLLSSAPSLDDLERMEAFYKLLLARRYIEDAAEKERAGDTAGAKPELEKAQQILESIKNLYPDIVEAYAALEAAASPTGLEDIECALRRIGLLGAGGGGGGAHRPGTRLPAYVR